MCTYIWITLKFTLYIYKIVNFRVIQNQVEWLLKDLRSVHLFWGIWLCTRCLLTMVWSEHHHSVVSQPKLIQSSEQTSNLSVHIRDGSVIVLTYTELEDTDVEHSQWSDRNCENVTLVPLTAAALYLEVFGNRSIRKTDVQLLDVFSPPNICPWVVGHGRKGFGDIGVRGQGHVF